MTVHRRLTPTKTACGVEYKRLAPGQYRWHGFNCQRCAATTFKRSPR